MVPRPSGIHTFYRRLSQLMTVSVVDLFCGGGGFSEGARRAGCDVVLSVDCDDEALAVHRANHPETEHVNATLPSNDVMQRLRKHIADGAHIHASPPCQKLSQANRRVEESDVTHSLSLVQWYIDTILCLHPASWSMEQVNVPAIRSLLDQARETHPGHIDYMVVDVADFGVPQNRRRIVAGLPSLIDHLRQRLKQDSRHKTCVRDVIPNAPGSHIQSTTTNTPVRDYTGRAISHRPLRPDEHIRSIDGTSYTILARNAPWWSDEHGTRIRRLTTGECALIQTFPSSYDFSSVRASAGQRVVGNAVPPILAYFIMNSIANSHVRRIKTSSFALRVPTNLAKNTFSGETGTNPST